LNGCGGMKTVKKLQVDWLRAVVFVALAVPVLRYSGAFQMVEPDFNFFGWQIDISPLTGLAFGLSYEGAIFLGIEEAAAARKRNNGKWWWPLVGALAQAAVGVFIVLPVIASELLATPLAELLGSTAAWLWSGTVSASTLLTFATVSLVAAVKPKPKKKGETGAEPAKPPAHKFCCEAPGCGYVAKSQHALNAHQRKHGNGRGEVLAVAAASEGENVQR